MKKIVRLVLVLILMLTLRVQAMNFEEAFSQIYSKPMLLLLYADWADGYQQCLYTFNMVQQEFGDSFNYVALNIASKDMKAYNARFNLDTNVPYILMFKSGGKVSRYLPRSCAMDYSCAISKIKYYMQ